MEEITILIPTYNRSKVLSETLQAFTAALVDRITYEIVVIDNGSSDDTRQVVTSFEATLPVVYLRETRPGKNCALNRAVKECMLRDLVVFADDDITPDPRWLQEILAASKRWPELSVFGARVNIGWPNQRQPKWAKAHWLREFGFAEHMWGHTERLYDGRVTPMGPCYWVRRRVFEKVASFNETIGPRPTNRIMGSEVSHLMDLQKSGFAMVYCPGVVVTHRINRDECTVASVRRRAFRWGRGQARLFGLHRSRLHARNRFLWSSVMIADFVYAGAKLLFGFALPAKRANAEVTIQAMMRIGKLCETTKLAAGAQPK